MLNNKIKLMIKNSQGMNDVGGIFEVNVFKKCNALNLTLKNVEIDINKLKDCKDLIKNSSSIFSNFRGNNLLTTATNLSLESNPSESFNEIITIYNKLKQLFFNNQFLVLAAQVIYNARNKVNVNETIENTRIAYDMMKKNHWFLTNSEDISLCAMIATTSTNLEETFMEVEQCYNILKQETFWASNNVQALSHILSFSKDPVKVRCEKVLNLNKALKNYGIPLKHYALPILGVAAIVTDDYDTLAKDILETDQYLKRQSGFGSFSLGYTVRSMISAAITCSQYIDNNTDLDIKYTLTEATNNTALNIVIIMQIAAATASAGAAAAAAASSSS